MNAEEANRIVAKLRDDASETDRAWGEGTPIAALFREAADAITALIEDADEATRAESEAIQRARVLEVELDEARRELDAERLQYSEWLTDAGRRAWNAERERDDAYRVLRGTARRHRRAAVPHRLQTA